MRRVRSCHGCLAFRNGVVVPAAEAEETPSTVQANICSYFLPLPVTRFPDSTILTSHKTIGGGTKSKAFALLCCPFQDDRSANALRRSHDRGRHYRAVVRPYASPSAVAVKQPFLPEREFSRDGAPHQTRPDGCTSAYDSPSVRTATFLRRGRVHSFEGVATLGTEPRPKDSRKRRHRR